MIDDKCCHKNRIKFIENNMKNLKLQLRLLCVALVHIQMLREEFIFIENLWTYWAWKCFCDDAVHRSPMSFQIRLVCIGSITIFRSAFVWLLTGVNLKNVKFSKWKHFLVWRLIFSTLSIYKGNLLSYELAAAYFYRRFCHRFHICTVYKMKYSNSRQSNSNQLKQWILNR